MGDDYEPSYVELGEPIEVFRPSLANVIAGFILGALAVLAGVVMIFGFVHIAKNPNNKDAIEKTLALLIVGSGCIGCSSCGFALTWFSLALCSYRVVICEKGFRFHERGEIAAQWEDIAVIRQTTLFQRPPILHPPAILLIPKVSSVSYTVVLKSGKEHVFDGNRVKSIRKFGRVLESMASRHFVRWEEVEEHDAWA